MERQTSPHKWWRKPWRDRETEQQRKREGERESQCKRQNWEMFKRIVFSYFCFPFFLFFFQFLTLHPYLSLSLGTVCLMNIFQSQYIVIFSTSQLIVLSHSGFFSYYFFVCVFEEFSFHSRLMEIFSFLLLYLFFLEFIYLFLAMQLVMQDLGSQTRDLSGALQ